jgi:hypothetical protein
MILKKHNTQCMHLHTQVREEEVEAKHVEQLQMRAAALLAARTPRLVALHAAHARAERLLAARRAALGRHSSVSAVTGGKADIIARYADYGSDVYAPVQRDGRFPDAPPARAAATTATSASGPPRAVPPALPDASRMMPNSLDGLRELADSLPASALAPRLWQQAQAPHAQVPLTYAQRRQAAVRADVNSVHVALEEAKKTSGRGVGAVWPFPIQSSGATKLSGGVDRSSKATVASGAADRKNMAASVSAQLLPPSTDERAAALVLLQRLLRGRAAQNRMYAGRAAHIGLVRELRYSELVSTTAPGSGMGLSGVESAALVLESALGEEVCKLCCLLGTGGAVALGELQQEADAARRQEWSRLEQHLDREHDATRTLASSPLKADTQMYTLGQHQQEQQQKQQEQQKRQEQQEQRQQEQQREQEEHQEPEQEQQEQSSACNAAEQQLSCLLVDASPCTVSKIAAVEGGGECLQAAAASVAEQQGSTDGVVSAALPEPHLPVQQTHCELVQQTVSTASLPLSRPGSGSHSSGEGGEEASAGSPSGSTSLGDIAGGDGKDGGNNNGDGGGADGDRRNDCGAGGVGDSTDVGGGGGGDGSCSSSSTANTRHSLLEPQRAAAAAAAVAAAAATRGAVPSLDLRALTGPAVAAALCSATALHQGHSPSQSTAPGGCGTEQDDAAPAAVQRDSTPAALHTPSLPTDMEQQASSDMEQQQQQLLLAQLVSDGSSESAAAAGESGGEEVNSTV